MQGFYLCWAVSTLVLLLLAVWAGRKASFAALGNKPSFFGILIDERERYSLNRLQLVMWTVLILATFLGLLFANLVSDPGEALSIPGHLLGLMGISAASATVSGAVKDYKNSTRRNKVIGGSGFLAAGANPGNKGSPHAKVPAFVEVFLEEEGSLGENNVVSVTKFQNFVFTIALGVVYIVLAAKAQGYPVLDEKVLWLIGISHAGYIGGKLPNKD